MVWRCGGGESGRVWLLRGGGGVVRAVMKRWTSDRTRAQRDVLGRVAGYLSPLQRRPKLLLSGRLLI